MPFTQDLQKLIAKYGADPSSIMIDDLPPLLDYIEQNSLHLDASAAAKIMQSGEQPPQTELPASCLVRGSQNGAEHNVALLTIGVHGNEIYAGAIAVLEVLHAAQELSGVFDLLGVSFDELGEVLHRARLQADLGAVHGEVQVRREEARVALDDAAGHDRLVALDRRQVVGATLVLVTEGCVDHPEPVHRLHRGDDVVARAGDHVLELATRAVVAT